MTKTQQINLTAARKLVNSFTFGTPEFESAMRVVRQLTQEINDATDFGPYTSVDGDIWSVN